MVLTLGARKNDDDTSALINRIIQNDSCKEEEPIAIELTAKNTDEMRLEFSFFIIFIASRSFFSVDSRDVRMLPARCSTMAAIGKRSAPGLRYL